MYQTIRVSSCLSIQGEFVEALANGDVVVRDGSTTYQGPPVKLARSVLVSALANAFEQGAMQSPERA
jgi:hypothetical protein